MKCYHHAMRSTSFTDINTNLEIYKAFARSPFNSLKQDSYFSFYQTLLAPFVGRPVTLVEVGVLHGGSLFMWRDFLGSHARIIGIDLNPAAERWRNSGFEIFIGSQSDPAFWRTVFRETGPIDILIDDGGHTNLQQIVTVCEALPHITEGGILVVEDVGTSYMARFGNPSPLSFINFAKRVIDRVNSRCFVEPPKDSLESQIASIHFCESLVAFHIDRRRCCMSTTIYNEKQHGNEVDLRATAQSSASRWLLEGLLARIVPSRIRNQINRRWIQLCSILSGESGQLRRRFPPA